MLKLYLLDCLLSKVERKVAKDLVVQQLSGQVPVICHVARCHSTWTTHMTSHHLLFHSSALLAVTVAPVSLSVSLTAVVDRLTYWASSRLLHPPAAYLTAPQVTVAAHCASVSQWRHGPSATGSVTLLCKVSDRL